MSDESSARKGSPAAALLSLALLAAVLGGPPPRTDRAKPSAADEGGQFDLGGLLNLKCDDHSCTTCYPEYNKVQTPGEAIPSATDAASQAANSPPLFSSTAQSAVGLVEAHADSVRRVKELAAQLITEIERTPVSAVRGSATHRIAIEHIRTAELWASRAVTS